MSTTIVLKRIQREIKSLKDEGIYVREGKNDDNSIWVIIRIIGPEDSPFQNGVYFIRFTLNLQEYPFKPPKTEMLSKIFHPNFSGVNICIDILKESWSSILTLFSIAKSLENLLTDPNPDSPLNGSAAELLMESPGEYEQINQIIVDENAVDQAYEEFE